MDSFGRQCLEDRGSLQKNRSQDALQASGSLMRTIQLYCLSNTTSFWSPFPARAGGRRSHPGYLGQGFPAGALSWLVFEQGSRCPGKKGAGTDPGRRGTARTDRPSTSTQSRRHFAKIWESDSLTCPIAGPRMKLVSFIEGRRVVERILRQIAGRTLARSALRRARLRTLLGRFAGGRIGGRRLPALLSSQREIAKNRQGNC
jgi:hypothetical protein